MKRGSATAKDFSLREMIENRRRRREAIKERHLRDEKWRKFRGEEK